MFFRSLLAAAALPAAFAQFVSPPTDLKTAKGYAGVNVRYKQVPNGICETNPKVKSFSGYADIAPDQHIFFWFFEAREVDPHEAPLSVWINGGPGSSSMIGLFQELGPCGVDFNGNVFNNPYSWTQKSNMIFIDQPSTVGFSYSDHLVQGWQDEDGSTHVVTDGKCPKEHLDTCGTYSSDNSTVPNSTPNAAPGMWKTLQGFMGAFPQYSRDSFHFATESYGGHYGPIFNDYFEKQNDKNIPGAHKINLESVLLGNAWIDPIIQYQAYYNFTVFPGNTYDVHIYNASTEKTLYENLYGKGKCLDQLNHCKATGDNDICSKADTFCANNIEGPYDDVSGRDEYDVRELMPDPFPYNFFVQYLNTEKVQKAMGAFVNYTEFSYAVGNAFGTTGDDARIIGTLDAIRDLLKRGVQVALYSGDADYNCNWLGGEVVAREINAPGWCDAGYADVCTEDGVTHGQVKQAGLFSFTRIYESGHEVPFYQPVISLDLFNRVISGRDIETGKHKLTASYRTKGPQKSTYREGRGTVQDKVLPANATYNTKTNKPNPF